MKKIATLFLLVGYMINGWGQVPGIEWEQVLGGYRYETINSIHQTTDGGYIAVGTTKSHDGDVCCNHDSLVNVLLETTDYWVLKFSSTGNLTWQKCLGGSLNDEANAIQQTSDGGYVIAGGSESQDGDRTTPIYGEDYWIVKLNQNGDVQWEESYGGFEKDLASSIQQTTDGGFIIAGASFSDNVDVTFNHNITGAYPDYWIVKIDTNRSIQWQKSFGGSKYDYANDIKQTNDGGYIVAGVTYSIDGDVISNHDTINSSYDAWIIKLDASGNIQWQKCLGGSIDDGLQSIQLTSDGGYVATGWTNSNDGDAIGNLGSPLYDYWIVKLDTLGNIQWHKSFGGDLDDFAYSVKQTPEGGYIVAGSTLSNNRDVDGNHFSVLYGRYMEDGWVIKLNANGVIEWKECLGSELVDGFYSVEVCSDGGNILAGYSSKNYDGNGREQDAWIVKFLPDSNSLNSVPSIQNSQSFISIFPNPASTQLFIQTSGTAIEQINIYNTTGSLVMAAVGSSMVGGQLSIVNLANGVYIAEIRTKEGNVRKRWVKM